MLPDWPICVYGRISFVIDKLGSLMQPNTSVFLLNIPAHNKKPVCLDLTEVSIIFENDTVDTF